MARRQNMIAHVKYHYVKEQGDITITMDIDLSRFNRQYGDAQKLLDQQVMTGMIPFMPMQTGTFVNVTRGLSNAIAGSGKVYAAAPPFGRYLYEGKVMVDKATGRGPYKISMGPGGDYILRFRKGAKLTTTSKSISYSQAAHPNVTDHWFDAAKQRFGSKWIAKTKRTAGGG